jgi:cytochrome c553
MRRITDVLRRMTLVLLGLALAPIAPASGQEQPATSAKVDFQRDIRPILAERCFSCHGSRQQESDFRLDRREDALKGGENGAAIVPGKAAESPLLERIASKDPDQRMPPKGDPLPPDSVAIIRTWIDQGAPWPDAADTAELGERHWALQPLVRPAVPPVAGVASAHPIDRFVLATLAARDLAPTVPADRRTLLRRLSIDLTGLPPTPEELAAFLADRAADAYERQVDRLLASPRYGERWARHWMDVVHFAETHGNDQDRPRPNAWPYRDYLIRSFNEDKPYARFIHEQVAGDVLFPDDPQAIVALGFLAAGSWDESSLMCIVDDTTDKKLAQVLDRDDMITNLMSTVTSTTVHCARCHNHKFDPISQADYYALQATLAGVDRAERPFDPDPAVHQQRQKLLARKQRIATSDNESLAADAELAAETAIAERDFADGRDEWTVLPPVAVATANGSQSASQPDGSLLFVGARPETDTYTLTLESVLDGITALQLEVLADDSLPHQGPGRQDNGNLHLSEVRVFVLREGGGDPQPVPIATALADFNQQDWDDLKIIDGRPETAWGIYPEVGRSHSVVLVLKEPLRTSGHVRLSVVLEQLHGGGHLIGRPRLSATAAADPTRARSTPGGVRRLLAVAPADRTIAQRAELTRSLVGLRIERELAALPPPRIVYAAAHDFKASGNFRPSAKPREVRILRRGDINQPLAVAAPGALSCIAGLEARFALDDLDDDGSRRAALARWLVDAKNVLTWRSIVNRVWHYHFGRGIVDTPNDLGKMGGQPSHPELLDWLAVEFRDGGGSIKNLHRLIVTSATYRQSSRIDPRLAQLDAENRLLWRMHRSRLDAETVRDAVLQISGKLDLTMGGPSDKQFVESPGVHVTPKVDYQSFDLDAHANFRRSVYRFLFRTLPDPLMESLDCPDGSQMAPVRGQSMTALQALTMLDNRFIVRQSEHSAARLTQMAPELPEQVRLLFQVALLRDPTPDESVRWQSYAQQHGLANACRMMFNTNEFMFVD